ncbi:MAG: dTDP-glucose 4,6-dehydratase [Candidatus Margulisbacteria bacterium]|nr:dTDP-glucose 4,6-dehydratase [Candidatus Margulisiibacteriota bacterium]
MPVVEVHHEVCAEIPAKKMLVTGGAGFIGSEFIRWTLQKHPDYQITNLDKLNYAGDPRRLEEVAENPNYHFVLGDIADAGLVTELFYEKDFDSVVNFAAQTHVTRSIYNPTPFTRTNFEGTAALLEAARRCWKSFEGKRFVQISTDEVYGFLEKDATGLFTESTALNPSSPYSVTKASADMLVHSYFRTYGLPISITRCTNNYGPWQYPEKLVPLVVSNALEDKPIPIHGEGRDIRDWLNVSDHCAAIDAVLQQGTPGEIYNIGGNNERETIEVVRMILRELHKPESLIRHIPPRGGHDLRYAIDSSKIKAELGWQPATDFETGMGETIYWYSRHVPWLESLKNTTDYQTYYQRLVADTELDRRIEQLEQEDLNSEKRQQQDKELQLFLHRADRSENP